MYCYLTKLLTAVMLLGCYSLQLTAQHDQHPIATQVAKYQNTFKSLAQTPVLQLSSQQQQWGRSADAEVGRATFFDLQSREVARLLAQPSELLSLALPTADGPTLQLELTQADIFSPDFQVRLASRPDEAFPYEAGVYYWGIVNGDEASLAAIAIHREEIMGTIHVGGQAYTLGRLQDTEQATHILYKKEDMKKPAEFTCGTDDEAHFIGSDSKTQAAEKDASNCVRMYVEVDYDIYQGKGGVTEAANYVNGVFSQVAILYANESIDLVVNELFVWDVPDPYTGPSTSNYLTQFRNRLNGNYNGDLAHLVGYQGGGGVAYVDVLCNGFYGVAYSAINSSYALVPTYNWSVEVLTHEIGHNLGSQHTHACAWNGNSTAIDGCGPAAGYSEGCNAAVPDKGTIMSYCHLVSGVGIDFNLGFGPQPGDRIRNRVYNASCLSACATATTDDAGITAINSPSGTLCTGSIAPEVVLTNFGTNTLTSVNINSQLDGGSNSTYNWSGSLAAGNSTTVSLPSISFATGAHTFAAQTSDPNGATDEDSSNDGASSNFTRDTEQTYYADTDGDGYGDPANTVVDCTPPAGYVADNTDCNDNDSSAYPGAPCDDGNVCTTNDVMDSNCNCSGTFTDSDGDGVCDANDICPGGDDSLDADGDGIPDACDCNVTTGAFPDNPLTHTGTGSNATTYVFGLGSEDPSFTITDLNAKIDGKPTNRYDEAVNVSYVDGNGNTINYGTFSGSATASVQVDISSTVQSVTISLTDGYDGNTSRNLSVSLGTITYCGPDPGCPDDDGDGVCNIDDICPGGNDLLDSDGDGIPDFCDNDGCTDALTSSFGTNPLNHSGSGSSTSSANFPAGNVDVEFTISGLDARTGGKPDRRYTEVATVTYIDGNGALQTAGTYSGDAVSTANVMISGAVQSVTVALSDGYDGDSGSEALSIDLSAVTSCIGTAPATQATNGSASSLNPQQINLYPNPAGEYALLTFQQAPVTADVVVRNVLGAKVATYQLEEQQVLRLPVAEWEAADQMFLITIYMEGEQPLVKKLLITK